MKQGALSKSRKTSQVISMGKHDRLVLESGGKKVYLLVTVTPFGSEDDLIEYRLENDPRFLKRIEMSRANIKEGRGIRMHDLEASIKELDSGRGPSAKHERVSKRQLTRNTDEKWQKQDKKKE